MKIKIVNCPDRDFKPYVEDAVAFFAEQLIPDGRIRSRCTTKVRFNYKIKDCGYASVEDVNSKNQPRKFLLEVNPNQGVRGIFETIAHEMVHIKQYVTGETNDSLSKWRGRKVDSDTLDYWEHPWEIDAFGREAGLTHKFVCQNQLWDVFEDYRDPSLPMVAQPIKWK
jgi:hypothetical protein